VSETSRSSLKNSGASAEFQQASLCEAAAADPAPRDTAALRDSVLRFRVAGKEKYSTATDETGGGVTVKWEWRQVQSQSVDEQDQTFDQHQSTEPRDGRVEF